jgi:hypothetical protein
MIRDQVIRDLEVERECENLSKPKTSSRVEMDGKHFIISKTHYH